MKKKFKWGIIGTGGIAGAFANDLSYLNDHTVAAVGSRALTSAHNFSSKYPGCVGYPSYSELVADPDLDGIYIATPHNFHAEHTILALKAGKPVLCEKPFALNVNEVELLHVEDETQINIKTETLDMYALKAEYDKKNNIIELFDNVKILRDNESISGNYAKINTLTESYKVTSKKSEKVKVLLNKTDD